MNNMNTLGTTGRRLAAALLAALLVAGCDAIDPTNVNNPTTTDDDLAQAQNPTASLLPGLRAQFSRMTNAYVVGEVITDNYSIHGTGIVVDMDEPSEINSDNLNGTGTSVSGIYWNVQELRALADFVIDVIAPDDKEAPESLVAEAHYYRGMAYLIMGEAFSYVPHEEDGEPQQWSVALDKAVADFEEAAAGTGVLADAALARAHRLLGNAAEAEAAANSALAVQADFALGAPYDANFLINVPWLFLVQRALQEMQPLPRLDFLDPKYTERDSPVPIAKAEEMHLILAEVALASGNLQTGREQLSAAIELAGDRPVLLFDDFDERRNADLSLRPRNSEIVIRADASSPYRAGLVRDRPAFEVEVPFISGTSLDADSVGALAGADELWHALWLARQEILFLEGRRLSDLGIRLPMMQREIDQNDGINEGDPGTTVVVPLWVPLNPRYAMDIYSPVDLYDGDGLDATLRHTEVTIGVDMNRMLAQNNASPFQR